MKWRKLGRLFCPVDLHPKLRSHAANPLAMPLEGDVFRVFFSGRDDQNRSSVGYVDVDVIAREVVGVCAAPAFEPGPEGSFFSHGLSIGNVYQADGRRYMLFMGWQWPPGQHWRGQIGRLVFDDHGRLALDPPGPLLALDETDRLSMSYPWAMGCPDGLYRMWYGSTQSWDAGNGQMLHGLNHAVSADGHQWRRLGAALPARVGAAQGFSRPSVLVDAAGGYHMWFSYRGGRPGETYRIGYAFSADGQTWTMGLDQAGIDVSADGWDAEMIEYPFVFEHAGQRFMLYCGNGFGRTGFGLAVLEAD